MEEEGLNNREEHFEDPEDDAMQPDALEEADGAADVDGEAAEADAAEVDEAALDEEADEEAEEAEMDDTDMNEDDIEEAGEPEAVDADGDDAALDGEIKDLPADAPSLPKRAMSAWALYITARHGGKPSKQAGDAWKAASEEEKKPYEESAMVDKERFQKEKATYVEWMTAHPEFLPVLLGADGLADQMTYLPQARVRKLMMMNSDVKKISKEALFLVCKSVEEMLGLFTKQCANASQMRHMTLTRIARERMPGASSQARRLKRSSAADC